MSIKNIGLPLLTCCVILICSCGCVSFPDLSGSPSYPSIIPEESSADDSLHTFTFPFSGKNTTVTIPVDVDLYNGAKAADKNAYLRPGTPDEEWVPDYYRAFVTDPAHDTLFNEVLISLKNARPDITPGTDEYADYITAFVQNIRYMITGGLGDPKFPVETIADEEGDCDDKSILLAGLLSREGYNVSLFYLEENNHMAVGIAGPACAYHETKYGYLEATSPRYIGTSPGDYPEDDPINEVPLVIHIGDGTQEYGACPETTTILKSLRSSYETAKKLEPVIKQKGERLAQQKGEIDDLANLLLQYSESGEIRSYNQLVPEYNRLVDQYNQDLAEHQTIFARYETAVNLYNLILESAPDSTYACTQSGICTATDPSF